MPDASLISDSRCRIAMSEPTGCRALRSSVAVVVGSLRDVGRDPTSIARTFDLGVDPLDIRGVQARSIDMLQHLAGLGADEVRCYPVSDSTHAARLEAIAALGALMPEI
jgi:hypothetical protein